MRGDSMKRETYAEINLSNLAHNIHSFKQLLSSDTAITSVIKANGYGHGAVTIAKELTELGINRFAVALGQEGIELREAGLTDSSILIFTPIDEANVAEAIRNQLTMTIFTPAQATIISQQARELQLPATVHLKVDTGMARLGVRSLEEAVATLEALDTEWITVEGIYTHFANGDDLDHPEYTHQQFNAFRDIFEALEEQGYHFTFKHCCNSSATIRFPDYHLDMVRIGLGMYGYNTDSSMDGMLDIRPIMTIKSHIAHVKTVPADTPVSYGWSHYTKEPTKIATLALGYADGVPRSLSNGGQFKVRGQIVPIIGRVCMDQLMLDVSDVEEVAVGDTVLWFGDETIGGLNLEDTCNMSNHYHYEVLCNLNQRLPRIYHS
ncbi:alanine racemase [Dolosigranulum pigrum]|nr:alanine racemase [Dolosigranulum pigrum]